MKAIQNSYPLWREAKVINTSDPEKLGRIQLKVYPELSEIPDKDCPWCFPHSGGIHGKSFGVPLKDQLITCIVWNKYWNEITFLPFNITKPTEHLFEKWDKDRKSKITDMKDGIEEEHLVVEEYEDGFTEFHDTKNNQHGFLHPSGTYITTNKDGEVFIQSVKKYTLHNKDSDLQVELDSSSGDVNIETKGSISLKIKKDETKNIDGKETVKVTGDATFDYKADLKIKVLGNTEIKTTGNTKIESTGLLGIKATGQCTVESSAMTTVKSSSMVVVDAPILDFKGQKSMGVVPPSGSGVFCAVPVCPATGAPHVG